jgi:hypothetical protein
MRKYLTLALFVLAVAGCTDINDELIAVNIRVRNVSTINFDLVQVGDEEKIHEDLAADSFSDYLEYEEAYSYAYIRIESSEETYVLQPIDFVGETPLPIGLYTYELDINEEGQVELNFVID